MPKPKHTPSIADRICARLAEGESLRHICETEPGCPTESAVRQWAMNDVNGFAAQYARARELGYHALADEIIHISNTPKSGVKTKVNDKGETETTEGDMIEHRRLQVEARKWFLSKVLPKVYGDKTVIEGGDKPIQHEHTVGLSEAAQRAIDAIAAAGEAPST